MSKPTADFSHFAALDIRVGRVVDIADAATRKPTYRLKVDFGPDIGVKVSCGAYRNYPKEQLLGKLVVAIANFGAKRMGPELSEVLILGAPNAAGETVFLTPNDDVPLGAEIF